MISKRKFYLKLSLKSKNSIFKDSMRVCAITIAKKIGRSPFYCFMMGDLGK
jgi:hypothetical protein